MTRAALLRRGACAAGLVRGGRACAVIAARSRPSSEVEVLNLLLDGRVHRRRRSSSRRCDGDGLSGELRSFAEAGARSRARASRVAASRCSGDEAAVGAEARLRRRDARAGRLRATPRRGWRISPWPRTTGRRANVTPEAFAAAARIVSVEARHAAWIRSIADRDPAPQTRRTSRRRRPRSAPGCGGWGCSCERRPSSISRARPRRRAGGGARRSVARGLPRAPAGRGAAGARHAVRAPPACRRTTSTCSTTRSRWSTCRRPSTRRRSAPRR